MAAGENQWLKIGDDDTVILSSHADPGQREQRQPGDRRPAPRSAPRSSTRASPTSTPPATPSRRSSRRYLSIVRARVVRARPRRVPPPRRHTPSSAEPMGVPRDHVLRLRGRRRARRSATTASQVDRPVPAGYLYVDGIVGDVGQGVLRDRKVLAEEGVVVVVVTVDIETGQGPHRARRSSPAAGSTRPRPRTCSTRRATRCADAVEEALRRRGRATSRPSSATCAGRPASSSTSAPSAGR